MDDELCETVDKELITPKELSEKNLKTIIEHNILLDMRPVKIKKIADIKRKHD